MLTFIIIKVIRDRTIASINGPLLDPIVNFFAAPLKWTTTIIPNLSKTPPPSDFKKWLFIISSLLIEFAWLIGVLSIIAFLVYLIYKRITGRDPLFNREKEWWIASTEMAAAVAAVDEKPESESTLDSMAAFLEAFDSSIATLLGLKKHEFRGYWLIPDDSGLPDRFETISPERNLDENDLHIIASALQHPAKKSYGERQNPGKYENYDVDHVLFCRNRGTFRLGYILFVHKENAISDKMQHKFFNATSSLLYLGHVDKFSAIMLKLKLNS